VPTGRTRAHNLGSLASAKRHATINTKKTKQLKEGKRFIIIKGIAREMTLNSLIPGGHTSILVFPIPIYLNGYTKYDSAKNPIFNAIQGKSLLSNKNKRYYFI